MIALSRVPVLGRGLRPSFPPVLTLLLALTASERNDPRAGMVFRAFRSRPASVRNVLCDGKLRHSRHKLQHVRPTGPRFLGPSEGVESMRLVGVELKLNRNVHLPKRFF